MFSEAEWENAKNEILRRIGDFVPHFSDLKNVRNGSGDWNTACCPFHAEGEEKNPSFSFHRATGGWKCFAGCGEGSFFDYVAKREKKDFKTVLHELAKRYDVTLPGPKDDRPPIPESLVDSWALNLNRNEEVRNYLREKRGLNDRTLADHKIGWDPTKERNTIPIRDENGVIRNVRLYNAKKVNKMLNHTDGKWKYGSPARLYGVDTLAKAAAGSQVLLVEGEWDRLIAVQEGFLAVTGTGGCRTFRPEWLRFFKGMKVVICYDTDPEGRAAVREVVLPALGQAECESVRVLWLPLAGTKTEKDLTDFFRLDHPAADLQKLIDALKPENFQKSVVPTGQEAPLVLASFCDIVDKKYVDKRVQCDLTVCGQTSEDFHGVEKFKVTFCPKITKGGCFDCKGHPNPAAVPPSAREFIGSCMSSDFQVKQMLREYACSYGQKPVIEILERSTVKEFFCHQRVRRRTHVRDEHDNVVQLLDGVQQELMEKRVYFKSHVHPDPKSYRATGWVKTHPKTQQVSFLIEKMDALEEDYESFKVTDHLDVMRAYKDLDWDDVTEDLTKNIVRIYDRDELLLATLLTYCSPRWIPFNDDVIRGWLVTAIIGDAGTGKTQTTTKLSNWLELGDIFSGLTGSRTGLSYALVEHKQKGWMCRIGRYPANNGRILIVDEAQHLAYDDTRTLAKAMEEGFLQIDRVRSAGFESQTRLILICNPRKDSTMDVFSYGAQALASVYTPTVIRRLDLCCFAASGGISDLKLINRKSKGEEPVPRKVTPEMLRSIILWAWKLRPAQILFDDKATELCLSKAQAMSKIFGYAHSVPLVTLADFRNKLARIAAAFAALWASTDRDFTRLEIKSAHVWAAAEFVEMLYRCDAAQLDDLSEMTRISTELVDYEVIRDEFNRRFNNAKHAPGTYTGEEDAGFPRVMLALRTSDVIRRDVLIETTETSDGTVDRAVKLLKRYHLVESTKDGYVKRPKFNKFLRRYLKDNPSFMHSENQNNSEKTEINCVPVGES